MTPSGLARWPMLARMWVGSASGFPPRPPLIHGVFSGIVRRNVRALSPLPGNKPQDE